MAKRAAATKSRKKRRSAAAARGKSVTISPPDLPSEIPSIVSSKKTLAPDPLTRGKSVKISPPRTLTTISDLKDLASSGMESLKVRLDACHSEALNEIDASMGRVSKRIKVQTQACLQLTEEAEKEYNKACERINETTESVTASYDGLITEAKAAASRVCKVSIPEVEKSMVKAIEDIRSRFKIPA